MWCLNLWVLIYPLHWMQVRHISPWIELLKLMKMFMQPGITLSKPCSFINLHMHSSWHDIPAQYILIYIMCSKIKDRHFFSFPVLHQAMQMYCHCFPYICQQAICQINNLNQLRHYKKTKPSVILAALLIANNKIVAKTNDWTITLVRF